MVEKAPELQASLKYDGISLMVESRKGVAPLKMSLGSQKVKEQPTSKKASSLVSMAFADDSEEEMPPEDFILGRIHPKQELFRSNLRSKWIQRTSHGKPLCFCIRIIQNSFIISS